MRHRRVREIMTIGQVHGCRPESSVRDAIGIMASHNIGCVTVTDGDALIGIFTERDAVRRVLAPGLDPDQTLIDQVMTRDPDTIRPEETVDDVIRRMDEFGYRHLPVVEDGLVVGMVSLRDCSMEDFAAMANELETRHSFAERGW